MLISNFKSNSLPNRSEVYRAIALLFGHGTTPELEDERRRVGLFERQSCDDLLKTFAFVDQYLPRSKLESTFSEDLLRLPPSALIVCLSGPKELQSHE